MMATRIDSRSLWFGLVAAPLAWTVQGLLGWFFGERVCVSMAPASVRVTLAVISVAALLVAITGIGTGLRTWRRASDAPHPVHAEAWDRVEFMALGGVLVSSAFAIGIFWAGLSSAFLFTCGRVR